MAQVAQFLWVGSDLSPLEQMCLRSFVTAGYDAHLYTYGDVGNVPEGVIIKDAGEIIPEDDTFFGPRTCGGRYANFSDRFRYHLLYKRGGWWFDTDHVALKLLPEPTDLTIGSQWEGYEQPVGGQLWCKAGDPRMKWIMEQCDGIIAKGGTWEYVALGPKLVGEWVEHFGLHKNVAHWWVFNPFPYFHIKRLVYRTNRQWAIDVIRYAWHRVKQARPGTSFRAAYIRRGSRTIHLSNEIWRAEGIDKHAIYHPRCTYGKLQRKYGFAADFDHARGGRVAASR